jgi:hypothetical protein
MAKRWSSYYDIVVTKDGKEYKGRYRTDRAKSPGIEVSLEGEWKYALLHASPPKGLARLIMLELIAEQPA